MRGYILLLCLSNALFGCTQPVTPVVVTPGMVGPADYPYAYYQQARQAGETVLQIDTKKSIIVVRVGRAGVLARLGHDHVVASHDIYGYVNTAAGRADLYVPLERLVVDEPELRNAAGLSTQPTQEAIEGTRHNMLYKVLDTEHYPYAAIQIHRRPADSSSLTVRITLHNTSREYEVPAQLEALQSDLRIYGQMTFNQSDFGITPFSVLGGAMQVQDQLDLRFDITATLMPAATPNRN